VTLTATTRKWFAGREALDRPIALSLGLVAFVVSFVDQTWRVRRTEAILGADVWPSFAQALAAVFATLAGFGATAIALVLALSAGKAGKKVLAEGGGELGARLASTLGPLALGSLVTVLASGLRPSDYPHLLGPLFVCLVTFLSVKTWRLWDLLVQLLRVYLVDARTADGGQTPGEVARGDSKQN
jgi:hypothetical protein